MNNIKYSSNTLEVLEYLNESNKHFYAIIDKKVYEIFHDFVKCIKNLDGYTILEVSEDNKSLETAGSIMSNMLFHEITTEHVLLNIGGGITTDIGGFVAATYKRGMSFINIPTTLIGQIDAAIGGKNAVNKDNIKNVIGTYYMPQEIIICDEFLASVSEENILCGKIEMLKMALTLNEKLLDKVFEPLTLNTIADFAELKNAICEKDPTCKNIRNILNYGHTVGHAIEELLEIPHGIAVGLGMYLIESENNKPSIKKYLAKLGLNIDDYNDKLSTIDNYQIIQKIKNDKKRDIDTISIIVLVKPGLSQTLKITFKQLEMRLQHE